MPVDINALDEVASKLTKIQLSDGWTFVGRSKRSKKSSQIKHQKSVETCSATASSLAPTEEQFSRTREAVAKAVREFKGSDCAECLAESLRKGDFHISAVVSAGLGSLYDEANATSARSRHQFAVFAWLQEHFEGLNREGLSKSAVEPAFTLVDEFVLEQYNIQRVDTLDVTEESVFYAPYLPWSVLLLQYIRSCCPAFIVCQNLVDVKESLEMRALSGITIVTEGEASNEANLREAITIIDRICNMYEPRPFPPYERMADAFRDLKIYARRPK